MTNAGRNEKGHGVCRHDHGMGPNKRDVPAESRTITRMRDEHSAVQLQEAPRTVQNGACGDECRPEQEWPPFVTTTMELDETKGACQLYSWQVAHVRFISDHVAPHDQRRLEWCVWR